MGALVFTTDAKNDFRRKKLKILGKHLINLIKVSVTNKGCMKICIIGAGWFGCHIAHELIKEGHDIKVFEKEKKIFLNASGNNQNRLHQGFHYPRSEKTIKISKEGFIQFKKEYGFLTKKNKK